MSRGTCATGLIIVLTGVAAVLYSASIAAARSASIARSASAAGSFVSRFDAYESRYTTLGGNVTACNLRSRTLFLEILVGGKGSCSSVLTIADDAYGRGAFKSVSQSSGLPRGVKLGGPGQCVLQGRRGLSASDDIRVVGISGSSDAALCGALRASGKWGPQGD